MGHKKICYGMVGSGGISKMHFAALSMETNVRLAAGCFSRKTERSLSVGRDYGLQEERIYKDYKEMACREAGREDGISFVVITTPNATHYAIAKEFLKAGIHVVCEKPLCFTAEQAEELKQLAEKKQLLFAVTYTYVGYSMVKMAREIVTGGGIGRILGIDSEYLQSWLLGQASDDTAKADIWRMEPAEAGASCAAGDIGTHIEEIVAYVTGMRPKRLTCVMDRYGMQLDLNANILVEYENNIHGNFRCSQVSAGYANGLSFRIFGTEGSVEWRQESPNELRVSRRGEPAAVYFRDIGAAPLKCYAEYTDGGMETIIDAFSNIYKSFLEALYKRPGEYPGGYTQQTAGKKLTGTIKADFPTVEDGIAGIRFVQAAVESDKNHGDWVEI